MSYRSIAIANAIVSFVVGGIDLLVPDAVTSFFGVSADVLTQYIVRLVGGAYLGYGVVNFLTRDSDEPSTRRAIAAASTIAWGASLVVTAYGQSQGLANSFGWGTVVMQLVFTVGWAWTYLAERSTRASRAMTAHG
jgi:NhaP-type Na+/H+ or K+/H+ antiporter